MPILGKTNLDEFPRAPSAGDPAYQTTHNPWDTERARRFRWWLRLRSR